MGGPDGKIFAGQLGCNCVVFYVNASNFCRFVNGALGSVSGLEL